LESCVGLAADYLYRGTSTWSRGEAYELHLCDCVKRGALFGKQAHCISVFYCVTGNEPSPDILTQLLAGTIRKTLLQMQKTPCRVVEIGAIFL